MINLACVRPKNWMYTIFLGIERRNNHHCIVYRFQFVIFIICAMAGPWRERQNEATERERVRGGDHKICFYLRRITFVLANVIALKTVTHTHTHTYIPYTTEKRKRDHFQIIYIELLKIHCECWVWMNTNLFTYKYCPAMMMTTTTISKLFTNERMVGEEMREIEWKRRTKKLIKLDWSAYYAEKCLNV